MKCLSIRQPWAWLILNGFKDLENRMFPTRLRGRILIHTGKKTRIDDHVAAMRMLAQIKGIRMPPLKSMPFGGIVGSVSIIDCVTESTSPWFVGKYGFVMRAPNALPLVPLKGKLGFFDVDEAWLQKQIAERNP
jgi:hypothetical protein